MEIVRKTEDSLIEIKKSLVPFDDSKNWNSKYTDDQGKIDKFNYMDLDPRQIAGKGIKETDKAHEILQNYWYELRNSYEKLGK
jgi:hypothetical protein